MSEARIGYPFIVTYADDSGFASSDTLDEVISLSFSGGDTDEFKVTNNTTSTGGYHEYAPGFSDPGSAQMELNMTAENHEALRDLKGVMKYWKFDLADGSELSGQGFIKTPEVNIPVDEVMTLSVELRLSGELSYTPPS